MISFGYNVKCGSYRGIKLLEHAVKVVERILEQRIWQQIDIDDTQFGFMKGKGTTEYRRRFYCKTDGICRRSLELRERSSSLALWIWKKLLIGSQEK